MTVSTKIVVTIVFYPHMKPWATTKIFIKSHIVIILQVNTCRNLDVETNAFVRRQFLNTVRILQNARAN